jgi:DNA-3-methyladenine glycosylase II
MSAGSFTVSPRGPFSLEEAATFGFGQRAADSWDGVMRLAFCLDGYQQQAGVEVRQAATGEVHGTIRGPAGVAADAVASQVARVLSLDHDGEEFLRVGARDPVIGRLQAAAPGLRPPLFYSPYEAAAWSVLSARRPARQMMRVRQQLSEAHGTVFELAGRRQAAFPTPEQMLGIGSFPGIAPDRMQRLHGVARAALAGQLDVALLRELGPERAMAQLQTIKGIGPFYSALIVIRGTGFTDVLPEQEPKALALVVRLYCLATPPTPAQFRLLAQPWRPFRTWAVVLIRAAGPRVLDDEPGAAVSWSAAPRTEAGAGGPGPGRDAFQAAKMALAAIAEGDWATVRTLLHPYVQWAGTDGIIVRGRNKVLAMLERDGAPTEPAWVELRDGQVYRWRA